MSRRRKRQFRYVTFFILPALLLLAALVPAFLSATDEANALSPTQWDTVRGYINSYFGGSQYNAATDGESGFRMGKVDLWNRLDSNGNIAPNAGAGVGSASTAVTGVLGEGDNAANRPVLIDNLMAQTAIIPGTEFRCNYNANESCFSNASITAIRQIVDNHKAAGFSTDIVDYCVSSQTAGPSTGGFGIIAQVPGALSSDTSLIPRVYNVDYSRNGWRNSLSVANGAGAVAAPEASAGGLAAPSTVANCDASATDLELVRCQANWAISSTGGNVGNGSSDLVAIGGAGQSVDVRNGTINTMSTAGDNLQVPINTLFTTSGLAQLDPLKTSVIVSRTQMGATSAIGLKMLGYQLITGGSINAGISRWAGAEGEDQVAYSDGLPLETITAYAAPATVDTTGPSVSSVAAESITTTSANIHRVALEPATLKVEYGTASDALTEVENNTVLNADKTVTLSGLSEYTHYYYRATSYDGYANATVNTIHDFWTTDVTDPVISNILPSGDITTADATLSADLSDSGSGINIATAMIHLDGGASLPGCTISTSNISCPVTGLAVGPHTMDIMVDDVAGNGALVNDSPFTVVDGANPTVDHTGPTATITSASTIITGTWSDPSPSSGVNPASLTVSLDDGTPTGCTIVGSDISCVVSSLITGTYDVIMSGADMAGNTDTDVGTLDINTSAPTIDPATYTPADNGWTSDSTPLISFDYTATGTVDDASITVDGVSCEPITISQTQASCTPAAQTDGPKDVHATVSVGADESMAMWTFNVDTTAPTSGDNAPTAWQNAPFVVTLTCDDGTGVGCGASAIQYRVNFANCPDWQCDLEVPGAPGDPDPSWTTGNTVDVNTQGVVHIIDFFSTDTLGNAEDPFQTVNVGLDMTVPIISDNLPAADSFTDDNTPTISAAYSDLYSGIGTVTLTIDGGAVGTCTPGAASLSCDAPVALDDGTHTAAVTVTDEAGNAATTTWDFNVDTAGPDITNILPAGNTADTTPTITATLADDAGVVTATVEVSLDGGAALTGCTVTTTSVSCPVATVLAEGPHTIHVMADDVLGQTGMLEGTFTIVPEMNYYVPWYDTMYGRTWMMTSMTGGIEPNTFDFYLRNNESGQSEKLNSAALTVYAGESIPSYFENEMDGPAYAQALNGPALVSERSLFGNSFEEIWAKSYEELDSHYWWPLYDNTSLGMRDWILAANPYENEENIMVRIQIHGSAINETMELEPGESWTPFYSGIYGGPVEVTAWAAGGVEGTPADARPVIASQRVLYNGAFNEMPGIGHNTEMDTGYMWTWYDDASPESRNWIVMSNPSSTDTIWGLVGIGDPNDLQHAEIVQIDPLETVSVKAPGIVGGPVLVFGCADDACATTTDIVASQRALWGPSFSEIAGTAYVDTNANWTWYDMQSAGARNWVLITNPDLAITGASIYAEITIHGEIVWSGDIGAMQSVTPSFPGEMNGPVTVQAWTNSGKTAGAEILASQRVLWNGYFNELVGKYQAPQ